MPAITCLYDWIAEGLQDRCGRRARARQDRSLPVAARVSRTWASGSSCASAAISATAAVRDLTPLTVFSSSNESVATVPRTGLVEKTGRGETAILARLLDKMATGYMTFLEDVKGFAWTNPPANNFVDKLVFDKLKQLQILPSDMCSDEEFVRRAYLDATGRLPHPDESLGLPELRNPPTSATASSTSWSTAPTLPSSGR